MQIMTDEFGNDIAVPAPTSEKKKGKKKTAAKSDRRNDYQIAQEVVGMWGKPLAFHAGLFWSYTPEKGWEACSEAFLALCNEVKGCNARMSIFEIVANQVKTPDAANEAEPTTYYERVDGMWAGKWIPMKVASSEIVFANGILDISTMKFSPIKHRIIYGPRISLPFDAKTSLTEADLEFEKMIENALDNEEEREYLQKLCSLILQPHVIFRGQIILWGVPHSGKSTIATAIACAPAGALGASAVSEERLLKDKWAACLLVNKFCNVSNDSEQTKKWEAWLKNYTTGMFTAEPKFHAPTAIATTAKLISTCNQIQQVSDLSGATEQRFRVFRFLHPLPETHAIDQTKYMTPAYWSDPARRRGVLGWLLRGAKLAMDEGIQEPASMKQAKSEAMSDASEVHAFVREELWRGEPTDFLETSEILDRLQGCGMMELKQLPKIIERIWGVTKSRNENKRGYFGLKLKE